MKRYTLEQLKIQGRLLLDKFYEDGLTLDEVTEYSKLIRLIAKRRK